MRRTIHITPLHLDVTELPLRTVTPNTNVHALNTKLCLFDMSRPHTNKEAIHILKALSTHTRNLSGHTLELDTILNIVTYLSHIGGNDLKVATVKFLLTTLNKNICLAHKEMKMSLLGSRKHLNDFISYLSCEDTCLVRQTLFLVLSLSTSERKKTSGNISPHALLLECRILDVLYNLLQHEKQDIVDTTLAILANLLKHNTPKDKCGVMEMILHVSRFLTGRSTMHREFVSLVVIANTLTDKCYRQVLSQNGIFECMEQYLTSHNDGLTLNALRVLKQLAVDECALRGFAYGGLLFHIVHTCIAKSRNIQIQIEALKVLQNLTCHSKGRSALFHVEGLSVLMKLFTQSLGHPDEYVCALLNAIYNLSYEPKFQHYFIQNDIVNVFAQFLERPTSFKIGLSILRVLSRFASSHVTYEFTYALLQHNLVPKLHFIYEDYAEGCKTSRSYAHDILCHLSGQKQFIVCYDSDIPWLRYQASVALGYLFTPDQADFLINKKKVVGTLLDYMVYCPTNKLLSSILALKNIAMRLAVTNNVLKRNPFSFEPLMKSKAERCSTFSWHKLNTVNDLTESQKAARREMANAIKTNQNRDSRFVTCSSQALKKICEFCTYDQCTIRSFDVAVEVLSFAVLHSMDHLKASAVASVVSNLRHDNWLRALDLARLYHNKNLEMGCLFWLTTKGAPIYVGDSKCRVDLRQAFASLKPCVEEMAETLVNN